MLGKLAIHVEESILIPFSFHVQISSSGELKKDNHVFYFTEIKSSTYPLPQSNYYSTSFCYPRFPGLDNKLYDKT